MIWVNSYCIRQGSRLVVVLIACFGVNSCSITNMFINDPKMIEGRVVDQYGKPVPDVKVEYSKGNNPWFGVELVPIGGSVARFEEETDSKGRFYIKSYADNISGPWLEKEGYVYFPTHNNPSEDKTYVMWRRGKPANKIVWLNIPGRVNQNETKRFPEYIPSYEYPIRVEVTASSAGTYKELLGWSITLGVVGGGIQLAKDIYPFEAPEGGYQDTITLSDSIEDDGVVAEKVTRYMYFRTGEGHYGYFEASISPYGYWDRNKEQYQIYTNFKYWINPDGSRNLLRDTRDGR